MDKSLNKFFETKSPLKNFESQGYFVDRCVKNYNQQLSCFNIECVALA